MTPSVSRISKTPPRPVVRIRRARQCDAVAIKSLLRESFREYEQAYTREAFEITTPGEREIGDRIKHWTVWVAVHANVIVGTVSAHREGKALHIRSMAVLPAMRGQGIGKALLAYVEDFACTNGYKRLILNTTPFLTRAIRLYEAFGFEFTGSEQNWFGTRLSAMTKPLNSARLITVFLFCLLGCGKNYVGRILTHGFIGIAALLTVYFVWGSTYLAIRVAVRNIPPVMMTGWRFLIAGFVLYSFLRIRGHRAPSMVQWRGAAVAGLLMLVLGNGGLAFSEQRIESGLAALVVASVPLWAAIFAGLWGKWPAGLEWTGLTFGTLGIVLLNLTAGLRGSPTAATVLLFASASFALGSVWSSRLSLPDGLMGSAAEMLAGGGMLVLLSILKGDRLRTVPPVASLLSFAYLIIFGSLIAYSAYVYLVRHLRPTVATSYAFVNPIVAVALASPILGESITVTEILAMIVILAGVALVLSGQRNGVKAGQAPGSLTGFLLNDKPTSRPRLQQSSTRPCCGLPDSYTRMDLNAHDRLHNSAG